jgi:hypothetical protein
VQNRIEQLYERKIACTFSGAIMLLFVALVSVAHITGRWAAMFAGLTAVVLALVAGFVWAIHLVWLLTKRPSIFGWRLSLLITFGSGVLAFCFAFVIGSSIADAVRVHEIQTAVKAGLQEDCMRLLQNWPVKHDRISEFDAEFAELPPSIRGIAPAYVINSQVDNPEQPLNLGICKNGWGGFAMGVRVFRSDDDAKSFANKMQITLEANKDFKFRRIAPGVYFWWQNT